MRHRGAWVTSLRTKLTAIVLVCALLPLAVLSLWLVRNTQRSAEEALRARLDTTLSRAAYQVGVSWIGHRSALFDIAQDSTVRALLVGGHATAGPMPLARPHDFANLRAGTHVVLIVDASNRPRWVLAADEKGGPVLLPAADSLKVGGGPWSDAFVAHIPVRNGVYGDTIGSLEARFRIASLVQGWTAGIGGASALMTLVDRSTGVMTSPLPFDAALLRAGRFQWGGDEWLAESRAMEEPYLEIVAAAPLTSFMQPFDRAARTGAIALAVVTVAAFLLVILMTRRVTRSLLALADAADAVAAGDLDRRVDGGSHDEVGRLASAFNAMVDSLRRTLGELSQRQAVAAVGEFASALAHEIRNPLSAIRINLQHVEEHVGAQPSVRDPVRHALRDIGRLESTVAGALRLARTGTMSMAPLALDDIIDAAARVVRPEAARRGISLLDPSASDARVRGNAAALEQLFLNLLLNAVEATPCGAGGRVGVEVRRDESAVDVSVWDTGEGFPENIRERAFEAFVTTKPEGTGLGLSVAKRIAAAHGGRIQIEPRTSRTVVTVRLPSLPNRNEAHGGSTPVVATLAT
jgi:two-component system sensor histidine kinase AtoS